MDIKKLISEMTIEEKASLCSGSDFWHTAPIERLNIPKMMVSDGPHGLRKQELVGDHLGFNNSIKAVCFPTGCTIAASFDRQLIKEVGEYLGESCQAEGVGVLLGPAVNIKRSPLCGRNFEYLSEDPYLSSEMASKQIQGVQSKHVGTSMKHYLANNQEHRRMTSSSEVDERTLREIYLASFETPIKEAQPWTVMCSYNKVNGVFASENHHFLTEVLRDEWGFEGFVVSDWGAVNNRVLGLNAGMDLEMPSSFGLNGKKIVEAVEAGDLSEATLNLSVERILTQVDRFESHRDHQAVFDRDAHHEKAREAAVASMVLLKNEAILPLSENQKIAFIGEFANKPRFQGGGSSNINVHKSSSALSAVACQVTYAQGYDVSEDVIDDAMVEEAVAVAKAAEVAVLFVGLPDAFESEGYDRSHMRLPKSHDHLIAEVTKVQPNVVVVLHNGSPVEMPWVEDVKGILEAYLSGQSVGEATIDLLFGKANPSGKLAETFPLALEDNPSYLFYLGEKDVVEYREGIFVGYRYYDQKKMEVLFPFGHGLSYTSFNYSNMRLSAEAINDNDLVTVTIDITNTGAVFGKEVVQLYVSDLESTVIRPSNELKGFEKVALNPGETKEVTFILNKRSFAYYNTEISDWHVETGDFEIRVGKSSRDIQCVKAIHVTTTLIMRDQYHMNTLLGDLMPNPRAMEILKPVLKGLEQAFGGAEEEKSEAGEAAKAVTNDMKEAMFRYMPLRNFITFSQGHISEEFLQGLIDEMNHLD